MPKDSKIDEKDLMTQITELREKYTILKKQYDNLIDDYEQLIMEDFFVSSEET